MKIEIESSKSHWFDLVPNIFCRNRHRIILKFGSQIKVESNRTVETCNQITPNQIARFYSNLQIRFDFAQP